MQERKFVIKFWQWVCRKIVGAKNCNFTGRMMGFERAAVLQERDIGTTIQEHGLNTWQQPKWVKWVSEITGKMKGNVTVPLPQSSLTRGLLQSTAAQQTGAHILPGAVGTEGGIWRQSSKVGIGNDYWLFSAVHGQGMGEVNLFQLKEPPSHIRHSKLF